MLDEVILALQEYQPLEIEPILWIYLLQGLDLCFFLQIKGVYCSALITMLHRLGWKKRLALSSGCTPWDSLLRGDLLPGFSTVLPTI